MILSEQDIKEIEKEHDAWHVRTYNYSFSLFFEMKDNCQLCKKIHAQRWGINFDNWMKYEN